MKAVSKSVSEMNIKSLKRERENEKQKFLKTVDASVSGGSNPSLSADKIPLRFSSGFFMPAFGCSQSRIRVRPSIFPAIQKTTTNNR